MAQYLLARSAQLFSNMMAERQARAAAQPADPRSSAEILADIDRRLVQPAPELPSLIGALAMRAATCGAHRVEVTA